MIPPLEIVDYPDLEVRGFMLDISRSKVPNVETIYKYIDVLSRLRYNHFELYVEGFSFEYKSMPFVNKDGNYISVEEYKKIEAYCYEHFIDLVPNQNGFGHMTDWLKLDEFKYLSNVDGLFNIWGSNRSSSTLDPTNKESFELVKKMYGDMLPYSNSKYFNMNFDETDIVSALLDFNIVDSEEDAIDLCADIQGAVFANNKDEVAVPTDMSKYYREEDIKKYGVENPFSLKEVQQKIKETNLEKYGFEKCN